MPLASRTLVAVAARAIVAASCALALPDAAARAHAATPAPFDVSNRNSMRGPELYGRTPANVRWTADGRWIFDLLERVPARRGIDATLR